MKFFIQYKLGLGLAAFVVVFFLIISLFFINEDYYTNSIKINAFVLPFIFIGSVLCFLIKVKKAHHYTLSFKTIFQFSYFNLFIGFFISLSFILFYTNYISTETRDVFNYQFQDSFYQNAKKDIEAQEVLEFRGMSKEKSEIYAQELLKGLKAKRDNLSENILSYSNPKLLGFIFTVNVFYLLISLFLAMFLKTKTPK